MSPSPARPILAGVAGLTAGLLLTGCGAGAAARSAARPTHSTAGADPTTAAVPHVSPILTTAPAPRSSASDATDRYAGTAQAGAGGPAPGVDYADPLAVARAYVTARFTYRYTDPAGLTRACTAPGLTTAAFAARSAPTPAQLAGLRTAHEVAAAHVRTAGIAAEAPNTAATKYVSVAFDRTASYAGATTPHTQTVIWSLRLRLVPAPHGPQWRVDGVLLQGD